MADFRDPMAAPPNPQAYPRTSKSGPSQPGMTLLDAAALRFAPEAFRQMCGQAVGMGVSPQKILTSTAALSWDLAESWLAERQRRGL